MDGVYYSHYQFSLSLGPTSMTEYVIESISIKNVVLMEKIASIKRMLYAGHAPHIVEERCCILSIHGWRRMELKLTWNVSSIHLIGNVCFLSWFTFSTSKFQLCLKQELKYCKVVSLKPQPEPKQNCYCPQGIILT